MGEGFTWPESNHGIFVDHEGYVWIGGNGGGDSHVLKFTQTGEFVAQYGPAGARLNAAGEAVRNSSDPISFGRVAKIFVDAEANEAFLADGYFNRRVAVLDASTGEMKRFWGAYGNAPIDDPDFFIGMERGANPQFRGPVHCADVSADRLVYVCDRGNNRIQVFTMAGEFVEEHFYAPESLGEGSAWDVAFSRDPEQRYLFLADGRNQRVHVILRETMEELTTFGRGGRYPGHFYSLHSIATDSDGNVYTTETYQGRRIQKFSYLGEGTVPAADQGPTYPE
jgi:DNA-binding beta-propeller fold protein YncE